MAKLLATCVLVGLALACQATLGGGVDGEGRDADGRTAGEVYLEFILALTAGDWDKARGLATPGSDIGLLIEAGPMPDAQRSAFADAVTRHGYRALGAGESVALPGGFEVGVDEAMLAGGGAIVTSDGDPLPHRLLMVDGRWKADPGDLLALRRDMLSEKNSETGGQAGEGGGGNWPE